MTKRNPLTVVALSFVTLTVYAYWWLYRTTQELREETGREDLSPVMDVLLTLVTLGFWGIWAGYRNAKIAHEELEVRGVRHTDRSGAVGVLAAMSVFSGWAWLVSVALLQDDFNRLAETDDLFLSSDRWEETSRARPRARVELDPTELDPMEQALPVKPSASRAPSAPVFESSAPMPIVY